MSTRVSEELLREAVRFHGHLGPFLALGLKAGLYAVEVLGRDPFKMKAVVGTEPRPPRSCFVDGVQITTGCTMGKRNITLKEGGGLSVLFSKEELRLFLKVKDLLKRSVQSLFEVELITSRRTT
ncbi:hypothetical protein B6U84_06045 [Candidatus Bathyarchaeota archaeon ex4484_40]|nr:MAG: hypothetical protein B6U84_06045 [Candidatus Bathyarchaeota archaeon ex4484_40]